MKENFERKSKIKNTNQIIPEEEPGEKYEKEINDVQDTLITDDESNTVNHGECPICFDNLDVSVTPPCTHSVCLSCYLRLIVFLNSKECVVCRNKSTFKLIFGNINRKLKNLTRFVAVSEKSTFVFYNKTHINQKVEISEGRNDFQKTFLAESLIFPSDLLIEVPQCEWVTKLTQKEKMIRKFKELISKDNIPIGVKNQEEMKNVIKRRDGTYTRNGNTSSENCKSKSESPSCLGQHDSESNLVLNTQNTRIDARLFSKTILFMLSHTCKRCFISFSSRSLLLAHYKEKHMILLCELCVFNKPIFWYEYETYTRQEFIEHKNFWNFGLQNGRSKLKRVDQIITQRLNEKTLESAHLETTIIDQEGFLGHPICPFCNLQVYSLSNLHSHLHSNYHLCTLCEVKNLRSIFYKDFYELEKHIATHYCCYLCRDFFFYRSELLVHLKDVHQIKKRLEEISSKELKINGYDFNKVRTLQGQGSHQRNTETESSSTKTANTNGRNVKRTTSHPEQNMKRENTKHISEFPSFSNDIPDYLNVTLLDNQNRTLFLRLKNILRKPFIEHHKPSPNQTLPELEQFIERVISVLSKEEPIRTNFDNLFMLKPKDRVLVLKEFDQVLGCDWKFSEIEKEAHFPKFGAANEKTTSDTVETAKKKEPKEIEKKFKIFTIKKNRN